MNTLFSGRDPLAPDDGVIANVASAAVLEAAATLLRQGRLVAFPTETVYGLGADATNDAAAAAIFAAKGRPHFNPLIVHVPDVDAASDLVVMDERARKLAAAFWPGALTLVLPRRPDCRASLLCSAGLDSLAVRVPSHPLALALLRTTGRPVAAPSANRSGRVSPTTARHVAEELAGQVALILDGGACAIGVESTVLDLSGPCAAVLRPGGVSEAEISALLGRTVGRRHHSVAGSDARAGLLSPGLMESHYAPARRVRLNVTVPDPREAFIAFGRPLPGTRPEAQLSASGDTIEAAARLFATLRALDRPPFTGIAVMPIPETGLGVAINDRLRRAAAPRRG